MKVKLLEIADISTGYTFRKAIIISNDVGVGVIQIKDIKENLVITNKNLVKTLIDPNRTNALVSSGDVVMGSRGFFIAAVVDSDKPIIASSSVFILRVVDNRFLPEYLAIYLNSNIAQRDILKIAKGSSIKIIFLKDLTNLEIPLIPIVDQVQLIGLYKNLEAQKKLLSNKIKIQHNIANSIIRDLLSQ
jgi:restriction endonuclease S subunit